MKERTKALISKNKNELPAAHALYVSLDRADNVIEGGQCFSAFSIHVFRVADTSRLWKGRVFDFLFRLHSETLDSGYFNA
jgi:hypothetical protein